MKATWTTRRLLYSTVTCFRLGKLGPADRTRHKIRIRFASYRIVSYRQHIRTCSITVEFGVASMLKFCDCIRHPQSDGATNKEAKRESKRRNEIEGVTA